jgi:redox-sensitive bicupin YhaK (pirin superfamily)
MTLPSFSEIVRPDTLRIGSAFQAAQLRENRFDGLIDPIMLVDHFTLSTTQDPYPYAGLSALTYLFADSAAARYRENSATDHGADGLIRPGDLHWLVAGRGALHGEGPQADGGVVHGLRVFINLPSARKLDTPSAYHAAAEGMPVITRAGVNVRLVAGESKNVRASFRLPEPLTLLDCRLDPKTHFAHTMPPGWNAVVYLIQGNGLAVTMEGRTRRLETGTAVAVGNRGGTRSLILSPSDTPAHAILLAAPAPAETLGRRTTVSPSTIAADFRSRRVARIPANGAPVSSLPQR